MSHLCEGASRLLLLLDLHHLTVRRRLSVALQSHLLQRLHRQMLRRYLMLLLLLLLLLARELIHPLCIRSIHLGFVVRIVVVPGSFRRHPLRFLLLLELHNLQLMLHIQQLQISLGVRCRVHHFARLLLILMRLHSKLVR